MMEYVLPSCWFVVPMTGEAKTRKKKKLVTLMRLEINGSSFSHLAARIRREDEARAIWEDGEGNEERNETNGMDREEGMI
jgi:hypothetical protein